MKLMCQVYFDILECIINSIGAMPPRKLFAVEELRLTKQESKY